MLRSFDAFQQFPDVVEIDTRPQPAKAPGLDPERLARRGWARGQQAAPQRVIDHLAERASRAPRHRLKLHGHILIQRQRGSHILMLTHRHHDVNDGQIDSQPS